MKISIVCSNNGHPIYPRLVDWTSRNSCQHEIELVENSSLLKGGDILFLISCSEIIGSAVRDRYTSCLVIHASDLPQGRGWSPHIWQILQGKKQITVTLLEAAEGVDTGDIWSQDHFIVEDHELFDEINEKLFRAEMKLMDYAVQHFGNIVPRQQSDEAATYYRKRKPIDSKIDPNGTIAEQFDLLRIADPERYPAFFDHNGYRYKIVITKLSKIEESN